MAGSDGSAYLSAVKWGDEGYYLKEFTQKFTLPQVAKIIKGQYLNLGVPSLPSPSLNQIVFLASGGKRLKVAAQCVKFKDGRRVVPVGSKLAIPDNYEGWFEILSEDGRAVKYIESVSELARRFPETCLLRENIKAYVSRGDDAESVTDKIKTIPAGETLVLVSEVLSSPPKGKVSSRLLRCFTSKGETVYLSMDQRGKFSPVAAEENISGVHTIKNLLTKRFPLMVRLVHGKPPNGLKSNSHFVSEMRLYSLFEEESIVALPLLKDSTIVALPPSAPLKIQAPRNTEALLKLREYTILAEKCKKMMQEVSDRIQVFDICLSKELRVESKPSYPSFQSQRLKSLPYVPRVKHNSQRESQIPRKIDTTLVEKTPTINVVNGTEKEKPFEDGRYDEIDQIYDYVRGFAPLPEKIKSDYQPENKEVQEVNNSPTNNLSQPIITPPGSSTEVVSTGNNATEEKPEPPPIETIPARKMSGEESITSHQKITVSIINKVPVSKLQEVPSKEDQTEEHIYEKIGKKSEERKHTPSGDTAMRIPIRSSSAGKIHMCTTANIIGNNKLFIKSPAQQRTPHKSRFFKHSKSSPLLKDVPVHKVPRQKTTRSKSLTTSPLFNIRYKSLTNLAIDFNTLDSSNSGGQTSSGSGGSKERRLTRPKSLTNLFWEANQVENHNKYNLMQNDISNGMDNRKLIFSHEISNGKFLNNSHNKRIGTLYL